MHAMHTRSRLIVAGLATVLVALTLLVPSGRAEAREYFELKSAMNGKCLDILQFDSSNGAWTGMWDCWEGANQSWYWDGSRIRSRLNHKCLEVLGLDHSDGARVGMWDCWEPGPNQKWRPVGTEIHNAMDDKCLEIYGFDPNNWAAAVVSTCSHGGANQQWHFVPVF